MSARTAEHYLDLVARHAPVVRRVLARYGETPLGEYLQRAFPVAAAPHQARDDLLAAVRDYTASLLGDAAAGAVCDALQASPAALTANHHGVDFFSQSVQGSLLFALRNLVAGAPAAAPVFACGSVPLDNLTYPMGILLYGPQGGATRLPVFSNRYRRQIVSIAEPFDAGMVKRAEARLARMNGSVCATVTASLNGILQHDYGASDVLERPDYSAQSVLVNRRIWRRLFAEPDQVPQVVTLELEKITSTLLARDLENSESLAWMVHFDPAVRAALVERLDGIRGCWAQERLAARLDAVAGPGAQPMDGGGGTVLYWAINGSRRRVPLYLDERNRQRPLLRGVDDNGERIEFALNAEVIGQALAARRLLPSLLTCFLTISFARGITCAGAYYQAEYLPAMQAGVAGALRAGGYRDVAGRVEDVPTGVYLAGMQTVMRCPDEHGLVPAGPAEIAAAGGLTREHIERILALSVKDAHIASLFETAPDVLPRQALTGEWQRELSAHCGRELRDAVAVIR